MTRSSRLTVSRSTARSAESLVMLVRSVSFSSPRIRMALGVRPCWATLARNSSCRSTCLWVNSDPFDLGLVGQGLHSQLAVRVQGFSLEEAVHRVADASTFVLVTSRRGTGLRLFWWICRSCLRRSTRTRIRFAYGLWGQGVVGFLSQLGDLTLKHRCMSIGSGSIGTFVSERVTSGVCF